MTKKPDVPKFEENDKDPLLDISSMGSNKELWFIQWPVNQTPDFDGQEITLKLQRNGSFASFESLSGKSYELVSFASQVPDATVFQSSESDTKVVGKISRRVSLVHYAEPSELDKTSTNHSGRFYQRSMGTSSRDFSRRSGSLTHGSRQRNSSGLSQFTASPSRSSKQRSTLLETRESSRRIKKKHGRQLIWSMNGTQDSVEQLRSNVTSAGSAENIKDEE